MINQPLSAWVQVGRLRTHIVLLCPDSCLNAVRREMWTTGNTPDMTYELMPTAPTLGICDSGDTLSLPCNDIFSPGNWKKQSCGSVTPCTKHYNAWKVLECPVLNMDAFVQCGSSSCGHSFDYFLLEECLLSTGDNQQWRTIKQNKHTHKQKGTISWPIYFHLSCHPSPRSQATNRSQRTRGPPLRNLVLFR